MKKSLLCAVAAASLAALAVSAKAPKDPVVMTIDGKDVHKSEFEYLYNKNNSQQLTPLTFDEYVDMFVNYRLKVADALAAGLDTTASFKEEFDKFRHDLAKPYLKDEKAEAELLREAYNHMLEDVYVSHIMFSPQDPRSEQIADSIRFEILNGNITFEDAAARYSVDKHSAVRGGSMGWVKGNGRLPWAFEKASYDTPIGQISAPVNSGFGYHLVRPDRRQANPGEVNARHILILTRGIPADEIPAKKALIDSIYNLAIQPHAEFGDLAKEYSEDPGSAQRGGDLGWFGSGMMVQPFDSIAFAMGVGEISKPFKTDFGYHIIEKIGKRDVPSFEDAKADIEKAIAGDQRQSIPVKALIDNIAAATGSAKNDAYIALVTDIMAASNNVADSAAIAQIRLLNVPVYTAVGNTRTLDQVLAGKALPKDAPTPYILNNIQAFIDNAYDSDILDYQMDQLELSDPDFRNLVNEYRDGILLFDISNQKVWDRAAKDKEGLDAYFKANRDKYTNWVAPKYKSYVIFSNNDENLAQIKQYVNDNYAGRTLADIDQEAFTEDLRNNFQRNVKVERVIAAKGDNPITDYLGFGAAKPEPKSQTWQCYFDFAAEIIDQPTEVSDVRGAVVADYQTMLEAEWVKQLRDTHSVKINKKNLSKINK